LKTRLVIPHPKISACKEILHSDLDFDKFFGMAYKRDLKLGMSAVSKSQVDLNTQHQNYTNESQI